MQFISEKTNELKEILLQGHHVRIISHRNPDGDSLGSMLAFTTICDHFHLTYDLFTIDPIPENLLFLTKNSKIKEFDSNNTDDQLSNEQTDIIAFLDCGQLNRAGALIETILPHQITLNIDHHISNTLFADFNYVVDITSTCELLYHIIMELDIPLNYNVAQQLYVGVLTDTNRFQYDKVTAKTHFMIAQLLEYDVNPSQIYQIIYQNYPMGWLKLLQTCLTHMELFYNNTVALITFTLQDFETIPNHFDDTNILLPIIAMTSSIQIYAIIKEKDDGTIAVSLRSKNDIDISVVAQVFGGGGHKNAAGCRTKDLSLAEFKAAIINEIDKIV